MYDLILDFDDFKNHFEDFDDFEHECRKNYKNCCAGCSGESMTFYNYDGFSMSGFCKKYGVNHGSKWKQCIRAERFFRLAMSRCF